jgi:hypothetical protein
MPDNESTAEGRARRARQFESRTLWHMQQTSSIRAITSDMKDSEAAEQG